MHNTAPLPPPLSNGRNQENMGKPGYWTAMLPLVGDALDVLSWHAYPGYGLSEAGG